MRVPVIEVLVIPAVQLLEKVEVEVEVEVKV